MGEPMPLIRKLRISKISRSVTKINNIFDSSVFTFPKLLRLIEINSLNSSLYGLLIGHNLYLQQPQNQQQSLHFQLQIGVFVGKFKATDANEGNNHLPLRNKTDNNSSSSS